MKINVWSKTLLNLSGCLDNIADSIDKIVLNYGLNGCARGNFYDSFRQMNKMIYLTKKKITIINLKVLIEKCLFNLDELCQKILILKYIDKNRTDTIIKVLNLSRRTYFRKYNQALTSFSCELVKNGYDPERLFEMLSDEAWILSIYDSLSKNNEKVEFIDDYRIISMAKNNYKRIKVSNF